MITKIIKIFEWIIFILLLLVLVLVASPLLPTKQYLSTHVILTGSMEPKIKAGSIVFSSLKKDNLDLNDIIVFQSPENTEVNIIHRVSRIEGDQYFTKGDNNESEDTWTVFKDQIKGEVLLSIPYMGYVIDWMKTPFGFITILVLPAIFFSISQIRKIKEGINEEVEKRTSAILKEQKDKNEVKPPLLPMLFIFPLLLFNTNKSAYALFSASTEINDIKVTTESTTPDVVLNEVMWMGSSISEKDEWIELRNTTDKEVDISHWKIFGATNGQNGHLEIPQGYKIPPNGIFLISNKKENDENTALNVNVDLRSTNINLGNEYAVNGPIVLKNSKWEEIDRTPPGTDWAAGLRGTTFNSMQRYEDITLGWYTCINADCSRDVYWKIPDINFGTPGFPNL